MVMSKIKQKQTKLMIGFKDAKYMGIPCWFNPETNELIGKNWLYDKLLQLAIWVDINIIMVESFPIKVKND